MASFPTLQTFQSAASRELQRKVAMRAEQVLPLRGLRVPPGASAPGSWRVIIPRGPVRRVSAATGLGEGGRGRALRALTWRLRDVCVCVCVCAVQGLEHPV